MSQPTSVVVSINEDDQPAPVEQQKPTAVNAADGAPKNSRQSTIRGIAQFTVEEAINRLQNVSPENRSQYVGMLSFSPSTIEYLRAALSRPMENVTGEVRTRILKILDEAEKKINWETLRMMDA